MTFEAEDNEETRNHYENLSTWMGWAPKVLNQINDMNIPTNMKGAMECAMLVYGDNLLDVFRDSISVSAHHAGWRKAMEDMKKGVERGNG